MQTRTRNALVFAAGMAVVVAAVVLVAQKRETKSAAPSALDAIPQGALLVATAELEPLRRSGIAAPLFGENREIPGLGKVRDVCGFDPIAGLTELAVAVPASGDDGAFGLVAAGAIDPQALISCATKVIESRGGRSVVNTIGAFRTVRDASQPSSGAEIAVREGGPVLLGAGSYLRSMIDAADGHIPSVRQEAPHARLGQDIGPGAIRVTVVLGADQRRTLVEELSQGGATGSPAASVTGLGLSASLGERIGLHAVVACDAPKPCADLAKVFDGRRQAQSDDLIVRVLGVAPLLERLRIAAEGDRIHARVDMSTGEATEIVERILVLRAAQQKALDRAERPERPEKPERRENPERPAPNEDPTEPKDSPGAAVKPSAASSGADGGAPREERDAGKSSQQAPPKR